MEPNPSPGHHGGHAQPGAPAEHDHHAAHTHQVKPIDPGYRISVRITLWVIAGAVLIGLLAWWVLT